MQMNALPILNAKHERPPSAGQSGTAKGLAAMCPVQTKWGWCRKEDSNP
jgi:hypothetical protein